MLQSGRIGPVVFVLLSCFLVVSHVGASDPVDWAFLRVTNDADSDYLPQVDGNHIVWEKGNSDDKEIYLYIIDTETTIRLTNNTDEDRYAILDADGTYVVWQKEASDTSIYLYNIDTGQTTLLIQHEAVSLGDLDAPYVVWARAPAKYQPPNFFLYNIDTGVTTQLTNDTDVRGDLQIVAPYVCWTRRVDGDQMEDREIFCYDIDTGVTHRITNDDLDDGYPRLDPPHITWTTKMPHKFYRQAKLHNIDTGVTTPVTGLEATLDVAISGNYLVYRFWVYDIMLYNIATGVTSYVVEDWDGDLSRPKLAGDNIVFTSEDATGYYELYTYHIPTGNLSRINDYDMTQQLTGVYIAEHAICYTTRSAYTGYQYDVFLHIPPICDPGLLADLSGDCRVDMLDFNIFAGQWLDCDLYPLSACDE